MKGMLRKVILLSGLIVFSSGALADYQSDYSNTKVSVIQHSNTSALSFRTRPAGGGGCGMGCIIASKF